MAMFATGSATVAELRNTQVTVTGRTREYPLGRGFEAPFGERYCRLQPTNTGYCDQ
jgi:hypothetical protein